MATRKKGMTGYIIAAGLFAAGVALADKVKAKLVDLNIIKEA